MKRLIAGLTGTLVIGSVAAVVIGSGTASFAGVPTLSVTLQAPEGQTAVGRDDILTFGGQVNPAPPQTVEVSAHLRFEAANGQRCKGFGAGAANDLSVSGQLNFEADGRVTGSRPMHQIVNDPDGKFPTCHDGRVLLIVVARDQDDGQETTAHSNPIPIDMVGPMITETRLVDTNGAEPDGTAVEVLFSEPVQLPTQGDNVVDWEVDGVRPIAIAGTSTKKILTLAPPAKSEDGTPLVEYDPGAIVGAPGRETYQDTSAGNPFSSEQLHFTARDLVAPRIPDLVDVAGKTGGEVFANDSTPVVRLSNINSGHWAEVYLEATGNDSLDRPGDAFLAEDQADGSGAQIELPDLSSDGTYRLYAVARDNALCAPPDDQDVEDVCPNWSGADAGSTVRYVLDRVAPAPLFASVTNVGEVTVGLTEAVNGTNSPAHWSISGATVTDVVGTGARRTLTASGAVPGATVTYTPGDYADQSGNTLAGFSTTLLDALPPLVSITDPSGPTYVQATSYTIRGTAEQADQVEIFRNDTSGTPVATAPVSGGSWSVEVPLDPNQPNNFLVRGRRTASTPNVTGPSIAVSDLVQDSTDPQISFQQPIGGPFRGGQTGVVIDWQASDVPPEGFVEPPGPITIEYSKDGGANWDVVAAFLSNQPANYDGDNPSYLWTTPLDNTLNALIRLTATDKSGRRATVTSSPFEIDSILPVFVPTIVDARRIDLGFSEPVDGVFLPQEWEIDGQPASQITPTGPASGVTKARLTLSPLADDLDPAQSYEVAYESSSRGLPTQDDAEVQDKVGNPVIPATAEGAVAVPTQPPSGPEDIAVCTIFGTNGADTLIGTDGLDVICPRGGTDTVQALGGNDIIVPGAGTKTVDGGAGNDEISGGDGFDTLHGGPGEDVIFGYGGDDHIFGDDGRDILHGDDGNDTVSGGEGLDIVEGDAGDDHLSGDLGIDHLAGSDGNDTLLGGSDNDRLLGFEGDDQLRGGSDDDFLEGHDGVDILRGELGNDELSGSTGKDHLFGDSGNDHLEGGDENDRVDGGTGNDEVNGGNGNDSILGGTGNDRGNGGLGDDRIDGDAGNDVLTGSSGRDTLGGGSGNDQLKGSDDNDSLRGGSGRDVVMGEDGRDRLYGDEDSDRLLGGSKRDKLDGGTSRDICDGGPAFDTKVACEGGPRS
jgi:Ca2+-binding RTX toxin-like protein